MLANKQAYRVNLKDTIEIKWQMEELISKGLVRESLSPYVVHALLVLKKDGSMQKCMDTEGIKNITIKYRYSIHRLGDILDELHDLQVLSKVELRSWYSQIHIREGNE